MFAKKGFRLTANNIFYLTKLANKQKEEEKTKKVE